MALLRSTENPGGRRLSELLRQIRHEVEGGRPSRLGARRGRHGARLGARART
jgi:hypothetical protein